MVVTKVIFRCLLLLAVFMSPVAHADAMDDILERGTLRVGIAEFVLWAMPAKRGGHVGYDVDLGVKIANDPDIVIATITDTYSEDIARSIFDKSEQAEQRMRRENDYMCELPIDQTKPASLFRAEF